MNNYFLLLYKNIPLIYNPKTNAGAAPLAIPTQFNAVIRVFWRCNWWLILTPANVTSSPGIVIFANAIGFTITWTPGVIVVPLTLILNSPPTLTSSWNPEIVVNNVLLLIVKNLFTLTRLENPEIVVNLTLSRNWRERPTLLSLGNPEIVINSSF